MKRHVQQKEEVLLAEAGEDYPFDLDIQILKDADRKLWGKENVITTDSVILDHCAGWLDLTAECLEETGARAIRVWDIDEGDR